MKTIKKTVYYCEFCKKTGLSSGHMKHHETHCTGNINRQCGMCGDQPNYIELVAKYKAQMKFHVTETSDDFDTYKSLIVDAKPNIDDIDTDCGECPICTFTVIRLCGLFDWEWDTKFDLKTRIQEWWADHKPPMAEQWGNEDLTK